METVFIIFSLFVILGIIKKISDAERERKKREDLKYYLNKIENKRRKITELKNELKKEMIWFAFENKKIRANKYDLPDQNDYQVLTVENIVDRKLSSDTDILSTERLYDNVLTKTFPLPLLNNRDFTIGFETIKSIQKEIMQLPRKTYFKKLCQVCEGRGVLIGCMSCGRGKFAIEKNEIGQDICKFCTKKENSRRNIDLIRCAACSGSGKYMGS
ncbi:MAG: hypothetical protein V4450_10565 [Bacteroidota bacterium]